MAITFTPLHPVIAAECSGIEIGRTLTGCSRSRRARLASCSWNSFEHHNSLTRSEDLQVVPSIDP